MRDKPLEWFAGENSQTQYIVTGGLIPNALKEVSEYFTSKGWRAKIEFPRGKNAPCATTGGLYLQELAEFGA